jgi:ABC-2 type transport system ATP-binding protein
VQTGTLLALLGPNGAGKTTTVEICEGFSRADQGTVRVLGADPWREAVRLRPRVGIMLQGSGSHLSARVGEMLALVASTSAAPHDQGWLLELLGLTDVVSTPVRRLSGGQAQRLSLAMALVGRPEMLFLDEPTAGMDPHARRLVWEVLRAFRADGGSILLTTHLLDEVEALADAVVILDQGRVVSSGTVAELVGRSEEQLSFSGPAGANLTALLLALPATHTVAEKEPGSYAVSGTLTPEVLATVTAWCTNSGFLAENLSIRRRGLEDVYLELTGRQVRG